MDEDEERDAVFHRLEDLGYRVGQGLVERSVFNLALSQGGILESALDAAKYMLTESRAIRFSRDRPRLTEPLDMIKFVCKDLWSLVFRKQVDNLKTNHRVGCQRLFN
jgi:hypothetical protein